MRSLQLKSRALGTFLSSRVRLTFLICACLAFGVGSASAQAQLAPNQTNGFGNGRTGQILLPAEF
jgi:hypothetical protein